MSDRPIIACNPSDTLPTSIRYCWADLYSTYTMYNPPDVRWDVLNNRMSSYYVCYYHISGLNGVQPTHARDLPSNQQGHVTALKQRTLPEPTITPPNNNVAPCARLPALPTKHSANGHSNGSGKPLLPLASLQLAPSSSDSPTPCPQPVRVLVKPAVTPLDGVRCILTRRRENPQKGGGKV